MKFKISKMEDDFDDNVNDNEFFGDDMDVDLEEGNVDNDYDSA